MGNAKALILSFIFVVVTTGRAVEYDLEKLLMLAESYNKEIQLARTDLKMASALKLEALSTAFPKVNALVNYNRNFLENFFFVNITDSLGKKQTTKFVVSFKNDYMFNASINQTLFSFGKVGSAIRASSYYDQMSKQIYEARRQQVLIRVKKAFFQALLLQKVWQAAKESESSALDNYNNIKLKYDVGAASEFALLQADTRYQNAVPVTINARKNYDLAVQSLKALVEFPFERQVTLIGDLDTFPILPDSLALVDILERRPDYNALQWEKKLREKNVSIQFSNHLPTLSGNLIYSYGARSDRYALDNANDNFVAGLSLNIPIFSGLYQSAQVQKARIEVQKTQTQIDLLVDNIRIEFQSIYLRMQESRQRILASKRGLDTARRAFEIAETRAKNGLATQLELKDSRVFVDQAQINYYSAIADYLNAYFDWESATGRVALENINK